MNAPMLHPPIVLSLSDSFIAACQLDVIAFKPGNVSHESPGHGMTAEDFLISAFAAAPHVTNPYLDVGERVYRAIEATHLAVGCNTNLGIVLLATPLIYATQHRKPGETIASSLRHTLDGLTRDDAEWVYQAIRLANPGGLGESPRHDVRNKPAVSLLEAMNEAATRDRVAYQYSNCYIDILGPGLASLRQGRKRWASEHSAVTTAYLDFIANFHDSHILRKYGRDTADQVQRLALNCIASLIRCADWPCAQNHLKALDKALKSVGINPGTSADLTVATWLADRLLYEEEACISNHTKRGTQFV